MKSAVKCVLIALAITFAGSACAAESALPQIVFKQNEEVPNAPQPQRPPVRAQLIVDGKPMILLAGELHNSSASGAEYMERMWPRLQALGLNAVLTPVSWELLEPDEGRFDFTLVDKMLDLAHKHQQRLVLLWFGSWKNGVSSYAPGWVLKDTRRFPRAKGSSNQNTKDILSTLSPENLKADAKAFAALMRYLKQNDTQNAVIMVQVENEVGIKPEIRDLSNEGNAAFAAPIPQEFQALLERFNGLKVSLNPEFLDCWRMSNRATKGTWAEVFGGGPEAEEVFSAWHYARYIDQVAAAGQAEKNLPMYVNAWLASKPGTYPSGGPVAHMHDIWRAAAPHIAILAPDIYVGEFKETCASYAHHDSPLFVPEASKDDTAAARAYWVIGRGGIGFSPFGIESMRDDHPLVGAYRILRQLAPFIADAKSTCSVLGVYKQNNEQSPEWQSMPEHKVKITYETRLPEKHPPIGGIVVQTGTDEFLVAGYGFSAQFASTTPGPRNTHLLSVELGHFEPDGKWVHSLWLNGDETGANGAAKIPPFLANEYLGAAEPMILRVKLYRYD